MKRLFSDKQAINNIHRSIMKSSAGGVVLLIGIIDLCALCICVAVNTGAANALVKWEKHIYWMTTIWFFILFSANLKEVIKQSHLESITKKEKE